MTEITTPIAQQTIQAILTPALMISACGLLLLGLLSAIVGVVFALLDIVLAYRVLKLEVEIY